MAILELFEIKMTKIFKILICSNSGLTMTQNLEFKPIHSIETYYFKPILIYDCIFKLNQLWSRFEYFARYVG